MNSVHEGLYQGVPEIVDPHQLKRALNGKHVVMTGAGVLVGVRPPYGRVTAKQLSAAGVHMRAADEIEALAEVKSARPL